MPRDPKSAWLGPDLHAYLVAHGTPPDAVAGRLIDETARLGDVAQMQIAPEQGAFLTLLTRVTGARRALEVGTFTGYSALAIARGLPDDGTLLCCDVSEEWTGIARRYWDEAGVSDKIELRIAPALETLASLPEEQTFDLAFVDADKENQIAYVDAIIPRLRRNGLLLVDNVLWGGQVAEPGSEDETTRVIRAFNDALSADERVELVMLAIGDGLTLARVR